MKVIEITKNKKTRKILLLSDNEKVLRKKIKDELEKYNIVASNVYSFTKGKSVKMAVEKIRKNIDYYNYFMKLDLKNYYGSIDLEKLFNIIKCKTNDTKLVNQIRDITLEEKKFMKEPGISMGSPLSNILANIFLCDIDNKYVNFEGIYVRFCDDIFVLCNDKCVFTEIKDAIRSINLKINDSKTFIGQAGDSVMFLGKTIVKQADEDNLSFEEIISKYKNKSINERKDKLELIRNKFSEAETYVYEIVILGEAYEEIVDKLIEEHKYSIIEQINVLKNTFDLEDSLDNKILEIFSIRQKGYYISTVNGFKDYNYIDNIIDINVVRRHLNGEISLAVRLDREDDRSNIAVLDIDNINADIIKIENALSNNNIHYYKEFSGMKGFHYWIFFDMYYPISSINEMLLKIKELYFNDIPIEITPKADFLSETEQIIKIPYGIHPVNHMKSYFIGKDFKDSILLNKLTISEETYEKFIAKFEVAFPEGKKLIDNCSVVKQIIKEGIIERKMSHYKRLIILYVMKFLDNGAEMIHYILQNTDNYSFNITERNINKSFPNPISCQKIKTYVKDENYRIKCLCIDKVDCPLTKVDNMKYNDILYKEEIKRIIEEIIKLKNERKLINRNISALENKLEKIFDIAGIEETTLELGNLKRKNNKWIVEMEI